MKKNLDVIDRALRMAAGVVLVGWAYASGFSWGYVGGVLIATALVGWCPIYQTFGFKTCKVHD